MKKTRCVGNSDFGFIDENLYTDPIQGGHTRNYSMLLNWQYYETCVYRT